MNNPVLYYLNEYYTTITWAYVLIIPLFLATFLFSGMKKEGPNILAAVNLALGMMGLYLLAQNILHLLELYQPGAKSSDFPWFSPQTETSVSPVLAWILSMILNFIEPVILIVFLFSKRARGSWFLSFV